jgi:hypothetical protein
MFSLSRRNFNSVSNPKDVKFGCKDYINGLKYAFFECLRPEA